MEIATMSKQVAAPMQAVLDNFEAGLRGPTIRELQAFIAAKSAELGIKTLVCRVKDNLCFSCYPRDDYQNYVGGYGATMVEAWADFVTKLADKEREIAERVKTKLDEATADELRAALAKKTGGLVAVEPRGGA